MTGIEITPGFWFDRLTVNAGPAIFHQWEQLVASGCIENFRIAAGEVEGLREGWFFADSDAYKWLDAAARISARQPNPLLTARIDELIALIQRAQSPDGYIFTYNQVHFPGSRWTNLQIEHELYCHGHLIEAGVSHYQATGSPALLQIARRAADRIVADFRGKGPAFTPGHEEVELALLRLHAVTPAGSAYLEMARQFIEQRGRAPLFALSIARQRLSASRRAAEVQRQRQAYLAGHPGYQPFQLPPDNFSKKPRFATLRWYASALSGKYFQQHAPVRRQTVPVGHSVRFAYLETAQAMLARQTGDRDLLETLAQAWERMVTRRMYVTGGIGAAPGLEGFGRDDELDPEYAYAETCAALGSLFWNWEMAQATGESRYSDLFEWQLYNAAAVGMGLSGTTYLYNNPLLCRGGVTRQPWYSVPCCPSNLSRTWASLGDYLYSASPGTLSIHQYASSRLTGFPVPLENGALAAVDLEMQTEMPWAGAGTIAIHAVHGAPSLPALRLRKPSWAAGMQAAVNAAPEQAQSAPAAAGEATSAGFDPRQAAWSALEIPLRPGDRIEVQFPMSITLRRPHPRVPGHQGKVAVSRGPLVYCLESTDNPAVDIFTARLDPATLAPVHDPDLLDGIVKLTANTTGGDPLTFIPYFLWGNRGPAQMTVWVNA